MKRGFQGMLENKLTVSVALLLCATVSACGGSSDNTTPLGGGDHPLNSGSQVTNDGNPLDTQTNALNGQLSGKLISTVGDFVPVEFDLRSGALKELPMTGIQTLLSSDNPNISDRSFFSSNEHASTPMYLETKTDCYTVPTAGCVAIYDSNYDPVKILKLTDRQLKAPAKLSPSGEFVVVSDMDYWSDEYASITIFESRTGNTVDEQVLDYTIASRSNLRRHPVVAWGANNEVYYSVPTDTRPTIYITKPGTVETARKISLPTTYAGYINAIDVHPEGNQLLLEYRGQEDFSIILILNLDTLNTGIPAVYPSDAEKTTIGDTFVSLFRNPMWSPDGAWIMFRNHDWSVSGISAHGTDYPVHMIAMPASSRKLVMDRTAESVQSPAFVVQLENSYSPGEITNRWYGNAFVNSEISRVAVSIFRT